MICPDILWEKRRFKKVKDRNRNEVLEAGPLDALSYVLALAEISRLFYWLKCSSKRLNVGTTCIFGPFWFGPVHS